MKFLSVLSFCFCLLAVQAGAVDFVKEVYPVLKRSCFECHGREKSEGGLRLDVADVAGHEAVKSGELVRRLLLPAADEDAMPKRGNRVSAPDVARIKSWVEAGAPWPKDMQEPMHWSYVKPVKPQLPKLQNESWARSDTDRFILARLEAEGTQPSPEASASVLLRRLSFDTRGIPPSVEELVEFEKTYIGAQRDKVWQTWVERFLQDRAFGPKWARHWLDLARYADSHGFQRDDLREIWAFRDWVVDALNADMPFDQFTIEQVAGDLLPNSTDAQKVATGFHRCTPTNVEAGTEPEESRINQVIDRVNTTGAVWLGTTLECAQCHDHKYDPFSMKDYYGLLAYFNQTEKEAERSNPKVPGSIRFIGAPIKLSNAEREMQAAELRQKLESLSTDEAPKIKALKPERFEAESGSENEVQEDGSVLLTGDAPDVDTYEFEAALTEGELSGLLVEALADDSLPGKGPGRGDAARPNFVLSHLIAELGSGVKLKFAKVYASHSQKNMAAENLLDDDPKTNWAIMPKFGQTHWVALELASPLKISASTTLKLRLEQNFGGQRTIGRLRVTALSGSVEMSLPETEETTRNPGKRAANALKKQLAALKAPTTEVMKELDEPRMTTMFKRGDWQQPGDKAMAGTPAVFALKADSEPTRLSLARWLVSKDNPLTARVTVNRWWAEIFGQGIVTTVEDFGIKGEPPSHPELLDFLAVRLMEQGWSMKDMLREIFLSATYRQSAVVPTDNKDPLNVLLARGPRVRLDAEAIRDNALAVAGLLSHKTGGPSIRPPQPDGLWTKVGGAAYDYKVSAGEEKYRRGIYVVLKRGSPYPSMVNFDASARMACVVKRSRSNTPLQALTLLNDPVYVEAAQAMASRVEKAVPTSDAEKRIRYAFRLAVARQPSAKEVDVLKKLLAEAGSFTAVTSALLNLDETITKP
jgi:hypothetical protein